MAKLKFSPDNYQDLGAYALLKNIIENGNLISEDSRPYKVFTALLTQSGTDAPKVNILENTIGTVIFERFGEGQFKILNPSFNEDTILFVGNSTEESVGYIKQQTSFVNGELTILTGSDYPLFSYADGVLNKTPIEIRVYP